MRQFMSRRRLNRLMVSPVIYIPHTGQRR